MTSEVGAVSGLWRFPLKSAQGERLDEVEMTPRGVVGDRAYALIDVEDDKIVSAKNPRKWGRMLDLRATFIDPPAGDGGPLPPIRIDLPDRSSVRSDEPTASASLSAFFGRQVELTSLAPEQRTMEETWPDVEGLAPDEFIEQTRIATDDASERVSDIAMALAAPPGTFFDLAPLHLLTTSTLGKLSELHPDGAFDVRRYRPNVLVETAGASFLENDWINLRVGLGASAAMQVMLPTMRCIMTTMAQDDLPRDPSLLLTIARNNRIDIPGIGRWACAGVYGGVASPGTVRVGDPVSIG